jgi:sporulation protein YlmC with PRC-barrel domain
MTTTPGAPAENKARLRLSQLLGRPITDSRGESIGRVADVIVRLRGADYPVVTGLVASVGGRQIFVPVDQARSPA